MRRPDAQHGGLRVRLAVLGQPLGNAVRRFKILFLQEDARQRNERLALLNGFADLPVGHAKKFQGGAVFRHHLQHLLEVGYALFKLGIEFGRFFCHIKIRVAEYVPMES